ncbi:hypothetical protein IW261DRAFT_1571039 [Armillaria novae-zelandiae]|uniref:Uncharacterized protein n=1 Tax=Armillaria novae-zelandiae TaxID=153914 RepID=A0AA39UB42_9AGAR|nr:hypothetical protein IW261DRAFT_1571039 [Armillaria novae-zelandiae]
MTQHTGEIWRVLVVIAITLPLPRLIALTFMDVFTRYNWFSHSNSGIDCGTATAGISYSIKPLVSTKIDPAPISIPVDARTISAIPVDNFGPLGKATTSEPITTGNETMFDIIYEPTWVKDSVPEQITELSSSRQHSIALDGKGTVLVWATTNPRSGFRSSS